MSILMHVEKWDIMRMALVGENNDHLLFSLRPEVQDWFNLHGVTIPPYSVYLYHQEALKEKTYTVEVPDHLAMLFKLRWHP